jgi:hypothetical protein
LGAARVALALLAAAATPATVIALPELMDMTRWLSVDATGFEFTRARNIWLIAFFIALLHAVILGFPAFLFLCWLKLTKWWMSPISGFVIGSLPFAIFSWPLTHHAASYSAWDGSKMVDYIIDGVPTTAGWIQYVESVVGVGLFGIYGGVAAWLVWYWLPRLGLNRRAAGT